MARPLIREKQNIEQPVVDWAKRNGIPSYKMATVYDRRWPDRLFFIPGGRPTLIEFKKPGKEPTDAQAAKIRDLKALGYDVVWSDSKDDAIQYLQAAVEAARHPAQGHKVAARKRGGGPAV